MPTYNSFNTALYPASSDHAPNVRRRAEYVACQALARKPPCRYVHISSFPVQRHIESTVLRRLLTTSTDNARGASEVLEALGRSCCADRRHRLWPKYRHVCVHHTP